MPSFFFYDVAFKDNTKKNHHQEEEEAEKLAVHRRRVNLWARYRLQYLPSVAFFFFFLFGWMLHQQRERHLASGFCLNDGKERKGRVCVCVTTPRFDTVSQYNNHTDTSSTEEIKIKGNGRGGMKISLKTDRGK